MTQNPFDNQDFRKELERVFDAKLEPVTKLAAIVESHEAALNRSRGVIAALVLIWSALIAVGEWLFHRGH